MAELHGKIYEFGYKQFDFYITKKKKKKIQNKTKNILTLNLDNGGRLNVTKWRYSNAGIICRIENVGKYEDVFTNGKVIVGRQINVPLPPLDHRHW